LAVTAVRAPVSRRLRPLLVVRHWCLALPAQCELSNNARRLCSVEQLAFVDGNEIWLDGRLRGGYALGGNWSVKAEYLRVMLGDTTVNVPFDPANSAFGETGTIKVSQNIDLIRAGINYKFGGPAGGRY